MSTSTDPIVSLVKHRFDHVSAKKVLREKYQAKMTFAYGGGMWLAGPTLINTLLACQLSGQANVVLLDIYETPTRVDTQPFLEVATQRWQEQMNAWLLEYEQLQQQR